jgi:hypothetical protein
MEAKALIGMQRVEYTTSISPVAFRVIGTSLCSETNETATKVEIGNMKNLLSPGSNDKK